jgi:hypothetical protein
MGWKLALDVNCSESESPLSGRRKIGQKLPAWPPQTMSVVKPVSSRTYFVARCNVFRFVCSYFPQHNYPRKFFCSRSFSSASTISSQQNPVKSGSKVSTENEKVVQVKRVAVITGASSGIGMECAALFSSLGWEVHNISR